MSPCVSRLLALAIFVASIVATSSGRSAGAQEASISGVVWEDLNADATRQTSEPGLQNLDILLFGPAGEQRTKTDASGRYAFPNLASGPYRIRLPSAHAVYYWTFPARRGVGPYELGVSLTAAPLEKIDFGLHQTLSVPVFSGRAWENAALVIPADVRALVGGVDCTGPGGLRIPGGFLSYQIGVASAAILPGCGEPGRMITFTINGRRANETGEWQATDVPVPRAGSPAPTPAPPPAVPPLFVTRKRLDLTIGPPFAQFFPIVRLPSGETDVSQPHRIEAFIDRLPCGSFDPFVSPPDVLVVPPRELVAGCGFEGATITFAVNGSRVRETATWQAGSQQVLNITRSGLPDAPPAQAGRITPPDTGDGGLITQAAKGAQDAN